MDDFGRILSDLVEMAHYFDGCVKNAANGTTARKRFLRYIKTLEEVVDIVTDMMDGEDDGK